MREIPHFPCIKPDLAKAITLTEERVIIEKPSDIWNNPEDYLVQYKYDGVRCLIAPNTAGTILSAEDTARRVGQSFDVNAIQDRFAINWCGGLFPMAFITELFIKEQMISMPVHKPRASRVTSSVSSSSPLKYVSRDDKTRNRVNMQYITEDIMANKLLSEAIIDNKVVLDGEVWSPQIRLPEITGLWSAEQTKPDAKLLSFVCFDCFWVDEPDLIYPDRMRKLYKMIGTSVPRLLFVMAPQVKSVTKEVIGWDSDARLSQSSFGMSMPPHSMTTATSSERVTAALQTLLDYAISINAEGLIVRKWNLPYNCDRAGNNLYKLKSFEDSEFIILDVLEGIGKFAGVPIWICDNKAGGTFKVTAAGTIPEKEQKWIDRADWIGKPLKVKYERIAKSGNPLKPVSLGLRTSL